MRQLTPMFHLTEELTKIVRQIANAVRALINNDTTSPIAGLFEAHSGPFAPGDANNNGLMMM